MRSSTTSTLVVAVRMKSGRMSVAPTIVAKMPYVTVAVTVIPPDARVALGMVDGDVRWSRARERHHENPKR